MDIERWLEERGLARYSKIFVENEIDLSVLPELTAEDLKELGVVAIGHRRKLLSAIDSLRSSPADPELVAPTNVMPMTGASGAERRHLTILFCDMVGSTALSSRLDPEDMSNALRLFQSACAKIVQHWGGYIAKYLGDGLLVYFGYPQAHEDDAERAIRAALDLVPAVGKLNAADQSQLAVRVGIATGLVVVGEVIGEGIASEEAVAGATPNLAARLQAIADPDGILVAPSTRDLVGDLFVFGDTGSHNLKGFDEPIRAWRVDGLKETESRFDARVGPHLTPLVGRDHETTLLVDLWRQAAAGEGQVALISGEPGIGKSRLTQFVRDYLRDRPHTRVRYQCSPFKINSALHPIIEQIERAAGFSREDTQESKLDKLEKLLKSSTEDISTVAPFFAGLVSLPVDRYAIHKVSVQRQKSKTLQVLRDQLVGLAERQPVLLIFEDIHWIDPTSLELLDLLIQQIETIPVLTILTCRPEFQPRWADQAHVRFLSLNRLSRRHGTAMIEKVSNGRSVPEEVLDQIIDKTDGVPLFIEELTKTVLESGLMQALEGKFVLRGPLPPLAIPSSLQDSLIARLDRLAPVKEVAQIGAVIGREFDFALLASVAPLSKDQLIDALDELFASELVTCRGTPPEATYRFKHALVQDAAYQALLRGKRQTIHSRIAQVLEKDFPDICELQPEILARHHLEAGLSENAADYWLKAARLSKGRYANQEAASHLHACLSAAHKSSKSEFLSSTITEAQILLGDLASFAEDLKCANEHYELAIDATHDLSLKEMVRNKIHRSRFTSRDDAKIAYYEHGCGEDTLLFINPTTYGLAMFQPILEELCQEFRIVTVDCRGTGSSDPLVRPYTIDQHALDAGAVIAALGGEPVVGVGISKGANQLFKLAVQDPSVFKKLVTVGAPLGGIGIPGVPGIQDDYRQHRIDAVATGDLEHMIRVHFSYVFSEPEMEDLKEMFVQANLRLPQETTLSFFDPDLTLDLTKILSKIEIPTLVTHGT